MRIGITGGASSVDKMIDQAAKAEADGFASHWFPGAVGGDPLVALALAGRQTTAIELGTSVVQTYTQHPVLLANRAASVVAAMGRPGFTLGLGPSHQPAIEDAFGLSTTRTWVATPRSTSTSSCRCCAARTCTSRARTSACTSKGGSRHRRSPSRCWSRRWHRACCVSPVS